MNVLFLILGAILCAAPVVGVFTVMVRDDGVRGALAGLGFSLGIAALVVSGAVLIQAGVPR